MRPDVLILGQGLAGSLLGWALERAGVAFAIVDHGHAAAATRAAAGIVNPITGRRLVKSWRVDELLPQARALYQEIGDALGVTLWRDMRVRRLFVDERERAACRAKRVSGELAPFLGEADEEGFWIERAGWVDLAALLQGLRARWQASGVLRERSVDGANGAAGAVIDCRGLEAARAEEFRFVPWEFSKGELLELEVPDGALERDVVLNRRHWVVPVGATAAWVGATHEPGVMDRATTAAARTGLEESAKRLLRAGAFTVVGQRAGVRVTLPDKLPVGGWHPEQTGLGIVNGLGAKGALWAPLLASAWVAALRGGRGFPAEIDVRRFAR